MAPAPISNDIPPGQPAGGKTEETPEQPAEPALREQSEAFAEAVATNPAATPPGDQPPPADPSPSTPPAPSPQPEPMTAEDWLNLIRISADEDLDRRNTVH